MPYTGLHDETTKACDVGLWTQPSSRRPCLRRRWPGSRRRSCRPSSSSPHPSTDPRPLPVLATPPARVRTAPGPELSPREELALALPELASEHGLSSGEPAKLAGWPGGRSRTQTRCCAGSNARALLQLWVGGRRGGSGREFAYAEPAGGTAGRDQG